LLTGDLEEAGENILMTQSRLETMDILKVAHHGSSGATSESFLNAIQPVWAVISCGENNRYGHPHKETLERLEKQGCQWLTTSGQGAICIEFAQEGYTIYGYQKKD
ncbi:MAG: DNA internalization-related competence protein ComEC/Rec2, partial [Frisingicoccus sp.]|nr:DNA internalization-related competence protein ComEC/Rec2 [Frisingicoccus sp.]